MENIDKHQILIRKIKKLDEQKEKLIKKFIEKGDVRTPACCMAYELINKLMNILKKGWEK